MSNTKKINQEERKKELEERKKLEDMMEELPNSLEILTKEADKILKKKKSVKLNYDELKDDIDRETTEIVTTSASFFFEKEEIDSEPYLKEKLKIFHLTISNILFQMKTSEHAIIKLLEKIDEGAGVDRTFEVLSSLQRSKMDIVKHLSSFVIVMENNLKEIRNDYLTKQAEGRIPAQQLQISEGDNFETLEDGEEIGSIRVRGTKNLIQSITAVSDKINKEKDGDNMDIEES